MKFKIDLYLFFLIIIVKYNKIIMNSSIDMNDMLNLKLKDIVIKLSKDNNNNLLDLKLRDFLNKVKVSKPVLSNNNISNFDMDNILDNDTNTNNTNDITNNNLDKYLNVIFVDGAYSHSKKNNTKNGGFGIYIKERTNINCLKNFKLYKKCNTVNFDISSKLSLIDPNHSFTYEITNIRTEGYAILYSMFIFKCLLIDKIDNSDIKNLLKCLNNCNLFPYDNFKEKIKPCNNCKGNNILIVTDSEFWIKTITKWSKTWYQKNTILERANIDIVLYIMYYYNLLLNNNINVEFQHVKGHADKKKKDYYTYFEAGNIEADKLAVKSKSSEDYLFHLC